MTSTPFSSRNACCSLPRSSSRYPFWVSASGAQQLACVDGGCVFDRPEPAVGWMPIRRVGRDLLFE